jgi:hypothetical protein
MRPTNYVGDISGRNINGVVLLVACGSGNCGLVAARSERYEHAAVHRWILSDVVLFSIVR